MDDHENPSASEPIKNIVLVGPTGNGKSATGNSLIGKEVFISEILECQICNTRTSDGMLINVIDTPSLFDLSASDYMNKEINNCLTLVEGGLHAVVLVLSVGNHISHDEESALRTLQIIFGSKIVDYLVVLFTGGDVLEKENKTLDDYLSKGCPDFLKTILRLCGGRRVLFNNKTTDDGQKGEQVKQLLTHVLDIEKINCGKPFVKEMYHNKKSQDEIVMGQQKEVKSKNSTDTEVQELKKQLQMSYDQNMNMMSQMVENTLKQSSESHTRMLLALKENIQNSLQETESSQSRSRNICNLM